MKALLQRVCAARVEIEGERVGEIGAGLLVLLCAERGDGEAQGRADAGQDPEAAHLLGRRRLDDHFVALARSAHPVVATGAFGTCMLVHLVNGGPVTIPLQI